MTARRLARCLLILSAALAAFACWGLFTADGRRQFDEMAGMIPLAAGALAATLLLGAVIAWWRARSSS